MAKLVLIFNEQVLGENPLDKETITIGRLPDNDIHIDNLAVSGHHAKILTILNDSFLEDLNSTNGTFVNGKLVKKHALRHGEVITVGKHQLRYINEQSNSEEGDFERTMIIRPDKAGAPEKDASEELSDTAVGLLKQEMDENVKAHKENAEQSETEAAAPAAAAPQVERRPRIQILSGANAGKEMPLDKALTTLGKPGQQVAAITKRPQGCFLIHVDGGPQNKRPVVNDQEVGPKAYALQDHDVIEIAGVKIEFFFETD